ncbi:DUF3658 domain-containing protein [Brevibacillus brevis]|uniref:DUF3658 domain-containing protein n=1 Tax=Brevibacillus brevis TaxID=1393 RepID=UPI001158B230|nr:MULTISPECIES: DUF3658 domain-containing protein [Bacillales]TQR37261.1 hypothetical protein C7Y45_05080 [Lysinibacillus sp. SDF0063]UIO40033.1 DUF3658 domain-containing protein [Brevibacillus brevis]
MGKLISLPIYIVFPYLVMYFLLYLITRYGFVLITGEAIDQNKLFSGFILGSILTIVPYFILGWRNKNYGINEHNEIKGVPEHHFDTLILETVEKLHQEQGNKEFLLTARVIGEILKQMDELLVISS